MAAADLSCADRGSPIGTSRHLLWVSETNSSSAWVELMGHAAFQIEQPCRKLTIVSIDLPITSQVLEASPGNLFLCQLEARKRICPIAKK